MKSDYTIDRVTKGEAAELLLRFHYLKDIDNVVWTGVSFTCRGALIYNTSQGNKSVAALNFGSDKLAGPNFTVTLPANSADSALIRI